MPKHRYISTLTGDKDSRSKSGKRPSKNPIHEPSGASRKLSSDVPSLIKTLSGELETAEAAAKALAGKEVTDDQLDDLLRLLDMGDKSIVSNTASIALRGIKHDGVVGALVKRLTSTDEEIIRCAAEALVEHELSAEQVDYIVSLLDEDACYGLLIAAVAVNDPRATEWLFGIANDHSYLNPNRIDSAGCLLRIGDSRGVTILTQLLDEKSIDHFFIPDIIDPFLQFLGREALPILKNHLRKYGRNADIETELIKRGVKESEIESLSPKSANTPSSDSVLENLSDQHRAAYALLSKPNAKQIIFEDATSLNILPDRQAWITINDPFLAQHVVEEVQQLRGRQRQMADKALVRAVGVRSKEISEEHYLYYADEILDAVAASVKPKTEARLASLLDQIEYSSEVTIRYTSRTADDSKLGDKCGDCTATGSMYFEDSLMWYVSPTYNTIILSKGKRFLGKVGITLGSVNGEDSIILDFLEFNPQAQQGKPYYEDAKEALRVGIVFLRELAQKQNRQLVGLRTSNSTGAIKILDEYGESIYADIDTLPEYHREEERAKRSVKISVMDPTSDIKKTTGYEGSIKFFYQMYGIINSSDPSGGRNLQDDKLQALETQVVNPAQIESADVAAAMRSKNFETASELIIANSAWAATTAEVLGLKGMLLGPKFLTSRLEKIYAATAQESEVLRRSFVVGSEQFVRL